MKNNPKNSLEKTSFAAEDSMENKQIEDIKRQDWPQWKKQAAITYYKQYGVTGDNSPSLKKDRYRTWFRSKEFKSVLQQQIKSDQEKFIMANIAIVISVTLVFFFLNAVIRQIYVINFSVDAIVGSIALIFALKNYQIKYSVIKEYTGIKDYAIMDGCSILICLLLKTWLPSNLDFSLFVLMVNCFVQKRNFAKVFLTIDKSAGV